MRILIRRDGGIGDVVMASTGLAAFRELHLTDEIFFQTLYPEAIQHQHLIDGIITGDAEVGDGFDRVIDLRWTVEAKGIGQGKISFYEYANVNRIDIFLKELGLLEEPGVIRFRLAAPPNGIHYALTQFSKLAQAVPPIVLNLFCASRSRSYDLEQAFALIDLLSAEHPVVLLGSHPFQLWKGDAAVMQFTDSLNRLAMDRKKLLLNLMGVTTLEQAIGIIYEAAAVVTVDTGSLHIAGALGKEQVAIFGNITPGLRTKYYSNIVSLYRRTLPCQPCEDFSELQDGMVDCLNRRSGKPLVGAPCIRAINPEDVSNALSRLLNPPTYAGAHT